VSAATDLVGDIVYRSELWAEERKLVEDKGWKGHESRIVDLGLLANCLKGCLLQIQVWSLQVEV